MACERDSKRCFDEAVHVYVYNALAFEGVNDNFHLTDDNSRGCVTERGYSEDFRNELSDDVRATIKNFEDMLDILIHIETEPEVGKFAVADGKKTKSLETATVSNKTLGDNGPGCSDSAEDCSAGSKSCERHEAFGVSMSTIVYKVSEDTRAEGDSSKIKTKSE